MDNNSNGQQPVLTVDCVIFGLDRDDLKIMLIKWKMNPFQGKWALPGGYVHMDEDLDKAAMRVLREETGIDRLFLEQLYTFGGVDRNPDKRAITVAYYALVNLWEYDIHPTADAEKASWFSIDDLPALALDHERIVDIALQRLKGKVRYQPIGFELLPDKFTLTQLQKLYEIVLGESFDKRNFRKKILSVKTCLTSYQSE